MADYKRITQLISRSLEEQLSKEKQSELEQGLAGDRLARRIRDCLLYTSPSPRDATLSRMPSSA